MDAAPPGVRGLPGLWHSVGSWLAYSVPAGKGVAVGLQPVAGGEKGSEAQFGNLLAAPAQRHGHQTALNSTWRPTPFNRQMHCSLLAIELRWMRAEHEAVVICREARRSVVKSAVEQHHTKAGDEEQLSWWIPSHTARGPFAQHRHSPVTPQNSGCTPSASRAAHTRLVRLSYSTNAKLPCRRSNSVESGSMRNVQQDGHEAALGGICVGGSSAALAATQTWCMQKTVGNGSDLDAAECTQRGLGHVVHGGVAAEAVVKLQVGVGPSQGRTNAHSQHHRRPWPGSPACTLKPRHAPSCAPTCGCTNQPQPVAKESRKFCKCTAAHHDQPNWVATHLHQPGGVVLHRQRLAPHKRVVVLRHLVVPRPGRNLSGKHGAHVAAHDGVAVGAPAGGRRGAGGRPGEWAA